MPLEQGLFGPQSLLSARQLEGAGGGGGGGGDAVVGAPVLCVLVGEDVWGGDGGGGSLAHSLEILISAQFQN